MKNCGGGGWIGSEVWYDLVNVGGHLGKQVRLRDVSRLPALLQHPGDHLESLSAWIAFHF